MEQLAPIMTAAVVVAAVAIVLQLLILFAMYRASKAISNQIAALAPKIETLVETAQRTVEQSRQQVTEITTKTNAVLDQTKVQLVRVNEIMEDATSRAKRQLDRVELILDDTIGRVHETAMLLQNGVLRPLREVHGVAAGVRAAVSTLLRGGRPTVAQATQDDEMFI
jgi:F0F1-type ATP synthase membrane subunit b/b'